MKITDLKSYSEYATLLASCYGVSYQQNRELEDAGFLRGRSANANGEPWASFTKQEFFAILFLNWVKSKSWIVEYAEQKTLSDGELITEFKKAYPKL